MVKFSDTPQKPAFVPLKPAEVKAVIQAAPHPPQPPAEPKPRKAKFSEAFWIAWSSLEPSIDSAFKKWRAMHDLFEIVKKELEGLK